MPNQTKFDLKISKQICYFTDSAWWELFDIESGEVIFEGESYKECKAHFDTLPQEQYELLPN
ncbi:hypothetical protein [Vibrio gangliei]|uniref:hypothetical protein n=1 Tax=Vibrio gangliei TaxID=2077090 RepID=UPI000D020841|nr:hypothetical protein [Vibrio gangliei]